MVAVRRSSFVAPITTVLVPVVVQCQPFPQKASNRMAVFLISYDLRKPDFDYDPLYDALAKIKANHVQDSVWGVDTPSSAKVVFQYLLQHMHNEKDRLFVVTFDKKQDYMAKNSLNTLKSI